MPAFRKASKNTTANKATPDAQSKPASSTNDASKAAQDDDAGAAAPVKSSVEQEESATTDAVTTSKQQDQQSETSSLRPSWLGGTWPRSPSKTATVTELAKGDTSSFDDTSPRKAKSTKSKAGSLKSISRAPSLYMSPGVSSRSLPSTAAASRVSVSTPKLGHTESHDDDEQRDASSTEQAKLEAAKEVGSQAIVQQDLSNELATKNNTATADGTWGMTSWIPGFRGGDTAPPKPLPESADRAKTQSSQRPTQLQKNASDAGTPEGAKKPEREAREAEADAVIASNSSVEATSSRPRSWFGLWNGESSMKSTTTSQPLDEIPKSTVDTDLAIRAAAPEQTEALDAGQSEQTPEERAAATSVALAEGQPDASAAGRWSWWSRARADESKANSDGQIEGQPQSVSVGNSTADTEMTGMDTDAPNSSAASRKRERPKSSEMLKEGREDKITKQSPDGKANPTAAVNVLVDDSTAKSKEKPIQREQDTSNLLLPSLRQTYRAADSPGLLERLGSYFFSSKGETPKHPNLVKETPRIKHAIAIGVHGYFPAPLVRTFIGQPKGTSVRFATKAAEAIRAWSQKHGCQPKVDKIILEGEGKIEERVDLLWQLLIKQVELIREADFILVACHSQGVPVAVQLVANLIKFGVLANKRVGICAMAGVNLGPFTEYKSRWIGGSAGELFDFAVPDSQVSVDYESALAVVLESGIKVVLVGSIDDQLVSMESATFGCADHPGLYRAVFINGQVHAPTFVVHLVGFALKLRNLGVPDHGLIRELSSSLAGSFTGDGHSRLYEDPALYDLTIEFALETTACEGVPLSIRRSASFSPQNPYILPFAMRGVLEEQYVKSDLHKEMNELLSQFDDWKPMTKQLRDVKFRLEGVRSKI